MSEQGSEQGSEQESGQESARHEPTAVTELPPRRGLKKGVYLLPNLVTTAALFVGFYAIIAAMTGKFEPACIAIVVAGFLDALDGKIARLTKTTSEFGVHYDSMSDLVAFGVAPAVLLFSWALSDLGRVGWIIAFLYMCCAALRLARFNTSPGDKVFHGLASPAAAGTMATMVWTWVDNLPPVVNLQVATLVGVFTTVVALLMVSNLQYYSPKNIKGPMPFMYVLGGVLLFIVVAVYPPGMLLCLGLVYALSGPAWALRHLGRDKER